MYNQIDKLIRDYNSLAVVGFIFSVLATISFVFAIPCGGTFEGCDGAGVTYSGWAIIFGFLGFISGIVSVIIIFMTKQKGLLLSMVSMIATGYILFTIWPF